MAFKATYTAKCVEKFFENVLSLKVWGLVFFLAASTYLCCLDKVTGDAWIGGNSTVFTLFFGLRSIAQVEKIKRSSAKDLHLASV